LPQLAQAEARILPKQFEAGAGALIPHRLLDLLDPAGLGLCGAPGLGCGHTGLDSFVRDHTYVCANFLIKLILDTGLAKEVSKSAFEAKPEFHGSFLYVAFRALVMARASVVHCSVSTSSWRFPALVSW
jgi:hypothetical protein